MSDEPKPPPPPEEKVEKPPKEADAYATLSRRISALEGTKTQVTVEVEAPRVPVLLVVAVLATLLASGVIAAVRFIANRRRRKEQPT